MARLFKRGADKLTEPAKYIQASDSVSRPLSVLLTLALLCACVAIVVGLFFGGKWLVNEISGDEPAATKPPATSQPPETKPAQGAAPSTPTTPPPTSSSSTSTSSSTATPRPATPATPATQAAPLPNTGPANLPNTGPQPE